jgi:YidC/Oxa1 family membrane protein insertase
MITSLFNTLIFQPFYNCFVLLIGWLPFFDAGVIVIIFTVIVKIILLPLSVKASKATLQMKSAEKDLATIKEKYKDNKEEQSRQTIAYYKEKGINPFAGIFILLIQLPIILGLYRVFLKSGLPQITKSLLYPFVAAPSAEHINMMFLNLINIAGKSVILALIAGITTYIQIGMATALPKNQPNGGAQNDIARAMNTQMKYVFPVLVVFISYSISAALALYWITSNVFSIVQEMWIKKKYHKTPPVVV